MGDERTAYVALSVELMMLFRKCKLALPIQKICTVLTNLLDVFNTFTLFFFFPCIDQSILYRILIYASIMGV